jgi:hypothetical protein
MMTLIFNKSDRETRVFASLGEFDESYEKMLIRNLVEDYVASLMSQMKHDPRMAADMEAGHIADPSKFRFDNLIEWVSDRRHGRRPIASIAGCERELERRRQRHARAQGKHLNGNGRNAILPDRGVAGLVQERLL